MGHKISKLVEYLQTHCEAAQLSLNQKHMPAWQAVAQPKWIISIPANQASIRMASGMPLAASMRRGGDFVRFY
jgi:hypothetical protein